MINTIKSLHNRLLKSFKKEISNFSLLIFSGAPLKLFFLFYFLKTRNQKSKNKYNDEKTKFLYLMKDLKISEDWFSGKIPYWLQIFDDLKLKNKKINILEIGCWEGLSSYFFLSTLDQSDIICVDTWQGSTEHNSNINMKIIENNFDYNLSSFGSRVKKYKGASYNYFMDHSSSRFDIIYIDGSHDCDDVLIDSINCFNRLNIGGIMIFDDYFWKYHNDYKKNVAGAVNSFIKLKAKNLQIINVYSQIIIQKISE